MQNKPTETVQSPVHRPRTDADYRERIARVLRFIRENLGKPLELRTLARVAWFSPYHFHRIFTAHVGQTLGEYVRHERLRASAELLLATETGIAEIASACGYDTAAAFTKAFKRHFGMAPSAYRTLGPGAPALDPPRTFNEQHFRRIIMQPEFREMPELRALCVTRTGLPDGSFSAAADSAFPVLVQFLNSRNLFPQLRMCIGICPDDPESTPADETRYLAGAVLNRDVEPEGEVHVEVIPAGRWAVFTHKGPYDTLGAAWSSVYRDWLPTSGETLRDTPPFEAYMNDKTRVKPEDLITEIHIPIQ